MATQSIIPELFLAVGDQSIELDFVNSLQIEGAISWSFTLVHTGNSDDLGDLHGFTQPDFVGSSHLLSDEAFIFDAASLVLTGICLRVPEENFDGNNSLRLWLGVPPMSGLIRLRNRQKFAMISPSDYRFLSADGHYLLCLANHALSTHEQVRVSVHEHLDLLFSERGYCGLLLRNPLRSLTPFAAPNAQVDAEVNELSLVGPMKRFLDVIDEEAFDRMEDRDNGIRELLHSVLADLASAGESTQVRALRERCVELLSDYYAE